jgi:hypothetical protein
MFFRRQVLVNVAPGWKIVPSGTVTSETNCAQSHVALADASEWVTAAGTNDNNIAQSNINDATLNRDFITASSNTSNHLERQMGYKSSKLTDRLIVTSFQRVVYYDYTPLV